MHKLAAIDITKTFDGFVANDRVSLHIASGTIHGLLGENGAGKSTLMNILFGLYRPDSGEIQIDGRKVDIRNPRAALDNGIGMVHQHIVLVPTLTVTENILLVLQQSGLLMDTASITEKIRQLSEDFGFDIEPEEVIWKLPIGMQQRVEILKLLLLDVDVLIFDEPTSVLTHQEVQSFLEFMRRLREAGKTIVLITHKLEEILAISDAVSVMRQGRVVAECVTADTDADSLAREMIGEDPRSQPLQRDEITSQEVVLELVDVTTRNDKDTRTLDNVSFSLKGGRILGVAGVDGNGQSELAQVIAGLLKPVNGKVVVNGSDVTGHSAAARHRDCGIAYVPEDRGRVGLVMDHTVEENLILRSHPYWPFSNKGFLRFGANRRHALKKIKQFDIRLRSEKQIVRNLSGGNQQKIILARELNGDPKIIVVAQPTKGLDVGAIEFVQQKLIDQRNQGAAILYISTELEHLFEVADDIAVMFQGRIVGILSLQDATVERLGLMMSGAESTGGAA